MISTLFKIYRTLPLPGKPVIMYITIHGKLVNNMSALDFKMSIILDLTDFCANECIVNNAKLRHDCTVEKDLSHRN